MGDITIYLLLDHTLVGKPVDALAPPLASSSSSTADAPSSSKESSSFQFQSLSHVISADAPLAELMDIILSNINASPESSQVPFQKSAWLDKLTILDISYHPAKVISPIVRQFTQVSGPKSKTLQSLGWYPSGKLVVLPTPSSSSSTGDDYREENLLNRYLEWQSRNVLRHEEFAYNNPDAANNSKRLTGDGGNTLPSSVGVQWTGVGASSCQGNATMKPSEIFNAVEHRSDHDMVELQTSCSRPNPKKKPKRTEKERTKRLDALLNNLNTKSAGGKKKKKAVSEKVRTMLLKTRSEGNKKLRMEDRFHLEVVRLWDVSEKDTKKETESIISGTTSYRFFSRQATVGKVASTMAPNLGNAKGSEFLVSYPRRPASSDVQQQQQHEKRYRRLNNTMSLHDACTAGWVNEFDVVVVRIYSLVGHGGGEDGDDFGPSKSVLDPDSDDEMNIDGDEDGYNEGCGDAGEDPAMEVDKNVTNGTIELSHQPQEQSRQELQQRIHTIVNYLKENDNSTKKKKKPVSKQVRNMLLKSKSTGNARLKQEDRLYLEVILFHDNKASDVSSSSHSSSYRYFSKQNDMQHIITACSSNSNNESSGNGDVNAQVDFIAPRPSDNAADSGYVYQTIPMALTLGEAIQKGHVENFGRVLIRVCSGKNNDTLGDNKNS